MKIKQMIIQVRQYLNF